MKGDITLATIALYAVLSIACGNTKDKAPVHGQVTAVTDVVLRDGSVDTVRFGRLHEGEIAVRSITLRNDSAEPVVIVTHERSCGCVNVDYERRPIMPGESSAVEFTFDSRGEFGWQMKLVTLRLGAAAVPLKVYVEAEVER